MEGDRCWAGSTGFETREGDRLCGDSAATFGRREGDRCESDSRGLGTMDGDRSASLTVSTAAAAATTTGAEGETESGRATGVAAADGGGVTATPEAVRGKGETPLALTGSADDLAMDAGLEVGF